MRLDVTRKSDLAVQALMALNGASDRMKGPELAESVGSSAGFVSQAVTPLVKAGWVRSDPGPTGGYALSADLGEISVLQVIEAVEGPTDSGRCVLADRPCGESDACALHEPWQRARTRLLDELAAVAIADVMVGPATANVLEQSPPPIKGRST